MLNKCTANKQIMWITHDAGVTCPHAFRQFLFGCVYLFFMGGYCFQKACLGSFEKHVLGKIGIRRNTELMQYRFSDWCNLGRDSRGL